MIALATDAPHYERQQRRLCVRASAGLARTGGRLYSCEVEPLPGVAEKFAAPNWSYTAANVLVWGLKRPWGPGAIDLLRNVPTSRRGLRKQGDPAESALAPCQALPVGYSIFVAPVRFCSQGFRLVGDAGRRDAGSIGSNARETRDGDVPSNKAGPTTQRLTLERLRKQQHVGLTRQQTQTVKPLLWVLWKEVMANETIGPAQPHEPGAIYQG
jgi:hypothetical protein